MAVMLLEWVFTSVFLILVVLALRAALGRRMSAGMRYALWAVVLVRLLVPVQLFTSPLAGTHVFSESRVEKIDTDVYKYSGPGAGEDALKALGGQDGPSAALTAVPGVPSVPSVPDAPEPPSPPDLTKAPAWLGWAWLAGAGLAALVLLLSNLRFYWTLRRERIPLDEADLPLRVYVAVGLPSPCLFGIIRPAIYVTPEAAANPGMLRHVLAHEYTHYKHGDHIWSLLRCAALAAHWWNPLVWLSARLSQRDGELACDEGALKRLGDGERAAYGSTLLALVTAKPRPGDLLRCATTMAGDKKSLKERITRIAAAPKRVLWAVVVAVMVTALACMCAFGQAEPEDEADPAPSSTPEGLLAPDEPDIDVQFSINEHGDVAISGRVHDLTLGEGTYWHPAADEMHPISWLVIHDPPYIAGDLEAWWGNDDHQSVVVSTARTAATRDYYPNTAYWVFTVDLSGETGVVTEMSSLASAPAQANSDVPQILVPETISDEEAVATARIAAKLMTAAEDYYRNHSGEGRALSQTPDLNRSGVPETLRVVEFDGGMGRRLEAVENGEVIWSQEGFSAHAGWVGIFLCTLEDRDYLLRYTPTMYGGICNYTYTLFTLDRDGREKVARENSIEFDTNFGTPVFTGNFDPKSIAAFMDEINGLLANSVQLMNTDQDLAETFEREGRLYDSLGWLDRWQPVFVRDPSKSLLENLLAFQEAMEDAAAQEASSYLAVLQGSGGVYSPKHGAWMTLEQFCANVGPGYEKVSIPDFTVLDLDGDGAPEVIVNIDRAYRQWCAVLHEQDGEVWAYALYIRWLNTYTLKEDGAFSWSSSASENGWGKLRFTEDGYETVHTIWHTAGEDDSSTIVYYIGDKTVSQAEYDAAYEAQEAVPDAAWYDFTEENINAVFP